MSATTRNGRDELLGLLLAALVSGLILTTVGPVGYVVRVLRETGSTRLLVVSLAFLGFALLALLKGGGLLLWLTVLVGLAALLLARIEQTRGGTRRSARGFRPFDRYDR